MKYLPNPRFIPSFLVSNDSREIQREGAEAILSRVQAIARAIADTGDYERSLRIEDDKVVSDDPGATAIEVGTLDTPTYAPLRRGAEQVVGTNNVR